MAAWFAGACQHRKFLCCCLAVLLSCGPCMWTNNTDSFTIIVHDTQGEEAARACKRTESWGWGVPAALNSMGSPEVLLGSNGALKDLPGPDHDAKKAFAASDASDMLAGKAAQAPEAAVAQDSHRRSGRTRTVRVRDGFFDSSLL